MTQHVDITEAIPIDPNVPVDESFEPVDEIAPAPGREAKLSRQWLGTLGARLLAGVVAVVLAVVVATGAATYVALHTYFFGRLDKQLSASAQGAQIKQLGGGTYGPSPSPQKVWLAAYQPDGTSLTATNSSTVPMRLSASQQKSLLREQNHHETITTTDGQQLRVTTQQIVARVTDPTTGVSAFQSVIVVVGLSTDEITRTLHTLILLELLIGASAVLLAFGATAWGVRVSLGPLKRVTRTAQEVTAELTSDGSGLDRRVPETESATEVGQLATSFNTMLDTVQTEFTARRESEERMRQFLADASHELRTPLTSIRGYAELARMQKARAAAGGGIAGDGDEDMLGRIETEGTRMSRLVEDLLILARGDDPANTIEHDLVDLDGVVEDAVLDLRLGHPDRLITADIQPGLAVLGDRDQLLRLIRNLTGNAAVHTDPAGPIRVTSQREGDTVVIQVMDSGPGLPPDEAAHVFERFWRADQARTRVRGGSGLGMAIVAQIVAAHDGRAYFDSSVGRGSTVTVILPALG